MFQVKGVGGADPARFVLALWRIASVRSHALGAATGDLATWALHAGGYRSPELGDEMTDRVYAEAKPGENNNNPDEHQKLNQCCSALLFHSLTPIR